MLTILEALKLSTDYLEKKGIESPRLNAELMLSDLLNCKRLDLYLSFERPLKENEVDKLRDWIARRGKNEPLQYILGKTDFFGLTFCTNSSVLIPRQETETLVEMIIEQNKSKGKIRILDIGTGSGNIAVALAIYLNDAEFTAIDSSNDAIVVAKQNAALHKVDSRIDFVTSDIFSTDFDNDCFDLIVSNPPYVSSGEYKTLQKEITEYEPTQAVTDMVDGYRFYSYITACARKWLKRSGRLYFEVGKDQYKKVVNYLYESKFENISTYKDLLHIERVVMGEKL
ncbi:MAG: methyltransferase [Ignavibacteria bacterium]|nr:MAG: methyltransferase [Ignavibacteria bacterium]KAF0159710.1 MAG: methyltransferase [Ignavibacteria bacterium]